MGLESIGTDHAPPTTNRVIARVEIGEVLSAASELSRIDQEMLRLVYWGHFDSMVSQAQPVIDSINWRNAP
ncbi:MAG: hypothetical protein WBM90_12735 [Acidimicrobiia bacterium]